MYAQALMTPVRARIPVIDLHDVVDAVASANFSHTLQMFLQQSCSADHFAVFHLARDSISRLASGSCDGTDHAYHRAINYINEGYWLRDPAICETRKRISADDPQLFRVDITQLADAELKSTIYPEVSDRLVIAKRVRDGGFVLSVIRSKQSGRFSDVEVADISDISEMLISVIAKHFQIQLERPNLAAVLLSLQEIERWLAAVTFIPRREMQVCARILYGMSSVGIALDLGIGEESVKTYRKRAYQRLNIGCERELLTWFLAQ